MQLDEEAVILSPIFCDWFALVAENTLFEYDFGGLYILAYLALRRPRKWSSGKFPTPLCHSENFVSSKLSDIPHIIHLLSEKYLVKLFGQDLDNVTVVSIFASIRFTGIKKNIGNFVNECIVNWALHRRPFILLKEIPTPLQVLRMQARGHRVATTFLSLEDLSSQHSAKLHYMEGHQNHSKDAFEFFVHDLKHMENFIDPNTIQEQIGFFHCLLMMSSCDDISPKKYLRSLLYEHTFRMMTPLLSQETRQTLEEIFKTRFRQLWIELEYLISDMYDASLRIHFLTSLCLSLQELLSPAPDEISDRQTHHQLFSTLP
jgi:hypothetical protein